MKSLFSLQFLLTLITLLLVLKSPETALGKKKNPRFTVAKNDFICRKMRQADLKKLKQDMLEFCDLNKPFSVAYGQQVKSTTLFCCHKNPLWDESDED